MITFHNSDLDHQIEKIWDINFADKGKAHIKALILSESNRAVEEFATNLNKWVEYNKHDMGELGEFIRTEYVRNGIDQALAQWRNKQ